MTIPATTLSMSADMTIVVVILVGLFISTRLRLDIGVYISMISVMMTVMYVADVVAIYVIEAAAIMQWTIMILHLTLNLINQNT